MIAQVMVERWAEVRCVRSSASPQSSSGGGFVDDSLASWGCEWETIPAVRASYADILGLIWEACIKLRVVSTCNVSLSHSCKGEFLVGRREGTDQMIFEHLDSAFGCVNAVVVWLNEHELAIVGGEDFFDLLCALIVHHV